MSTIQQSEKKVYIMTFRYISKYNYFFSFHMLKYANFSALTIYIRN